MQKEYHIVAWIHPKEGGDDYRVDMTYTSNDKSWVEKDVKKWLKRRSDVINDFKIFTKTEYEEYNLKQDEYYLKLEKKVKEMRKKVIYREIKN